MPRKRPTLIDAMMGMAELVALRSTCARAQVGVVITDVSMRQVLSYGYNGNWAGGPNECDGTGVGACGCIHAEENALIKLSSDAHELRLFTTVSPCLMCAKRIINQGRITRVHYGQPYRDGSGLELLPKAGIRVEGYNGSPGA